jgi:hypothetical protein
MSARTGGSPPPQEHDGYDELAVGWALHALEPEDEAAFARHLPGCARCTRTVADTSEVMAAMATDLPSAEPSPRLRARLHAAVAVTDQVAPGGGRPDLEPAATPAAPATSGARAATGFPGYRDAPPPRAGRRWAGSRAPAMALAAAALAAVLGLGVWNVLLADQRGDLERSLAEQQAIVETLLVPGEATVTPLSDDGRAIATVVARSDRVDVVSHGLEVNDRDAETYVVWGLDGDQAEPLGTFDVTGSQTALQTVESGSTGLDDYSGYGISIEPGRQAPSAPTVIVATGEVDS